MVLTERKNYWSLDVAKLICAVLIMSAHFAAEWGNFPTIIDYGFSLYVIAVPFFFVCSGFLFFKKWISMNNEDRKQYLISYQKRIWIMYGCWTLVYIPFEVIYWIKEGDVLTKALEWLHTALVFQTYSTIWFLPALAVGIAVVCFLWSHFSKRSMIVIAALLYVFGMLGYTYNFLIEGTVIGQIMDLYLLVFETSRNGLFNAVPFIVMGLVLSQSEIVPNKKECIKNALFSLFFLLFIVVEAFTLKMKFAVTGMDVGLFLVPFVYFFVKTLLSVELADRKAWLWCRKFSLLIFVSQRVFLSALPIAFSSFFDVLYSNSYVGLVIVWCLTISFCMLFNKLSEKIKFLKRFI